jgi:thiamine-monophosphate kinase
MGTIGGVLVQWSSLVPLATFGPHRDGEFALIDWIRRHVDPHPRLTVGIGDDAAALDLGDEQLALVATDMLVEGVHFLFSEATPEQVGHKALAVNLSDIAAMAGIPVAAVVCLALPRSEGQELGRRLHSGLARLAQQTGVAVAGGDTTSTDGPLVISVTVIGLSPPQGPVLRSGARPGDRLLVTGPLGSSRSGHHLDFHPRLDEARCLLQSGGLHALIDISDGLAADLYHLLDESRVGARVRASDIPMRPVPAGTHDGRTPLDHALCDGEDFELLAAVEPTAAEALLAASPISDLTCIGQITSGTAAELEMPDGRVLPLPRIGYTHPFDPGT